MQQLMIISLLNSTRDWRPSALVSSPGAGLMNLLKLPPVVAITTPPVPSIIRSGAQDALAVGKRWFLFLLRRKIADRGNDLGSWAGRSPVRASLVVGYLFDGARSLAWRVRRRELQVWGFLPGVCAFRTARRGPPTRKRIIMCLLVE